MSGLGPQPLVLRWDYRENWRSISPEHRTDPRSRRHSRYRPVSALTGLIMMSTSVGREACRSHNRLIQHFTFRGQWLLHHRKLLVKAMIASTYASGSVACGVCPAPGNVRTSTRGSAAASLATTGAKIGGLWSPSVRRAG